MKLRILFLPFLISSLNADEREPEVRVEQPGITIELVAGHPDLATPTGVDVDDEGRIWVVACHTHMPPEEYEGPEVDEILIFGRDGERSLFYAKTHHTMDLELGPDGWVYLAERDRILRIRDTDGDGTADVEEDLAVLTTEADYPHNGLAGLAWAPDGDLVFGLGENYAKGWVLKGADDVDYAGIGEGGVFRCRPDGKGLRRIARGMWNPFGVCVRSDGVIFASDNDPGERPPCRLLHIVQGGDYGYQRMYGSESHHPFVGWNGQLRGTLPMVHPVGEAPCGLVPLGNGLLIPSWSDHRVDFHLLHREGGSFAGTRIPLVTGSRYFRPTCIAEDETVEEGAGKRVWYLTDWVDGRYPVHGYGRLWRMEVDLEKASSWVGKMKLEEPNEVSVKIDSIRDEPEKWSREDLLREAKSDDPFLARAAIVRLSGMTNDWTREQVSGWLPEDRVQALLALRISAQNPAAWVKSFLEDPDPAVVFEALRWISDDQLESFRPDVETIVSNPDISYEIFEAAVAASNSLAGEPGKGVRNEELLLNRVLDENSSSRIRTFALRLLPTPLRVASQSDPAARLRVPKELTIEHLKKLAGAKDGELAREAVRVLSGMPGRGGAALLKVAQDESQPSGIRADAVSGISAVANEHLEDLIGLAGSDSDAVRREALRALRGRELSAEQVEKLSAGTVSSEEDSELLDLLTNPADLFQGRPAPDDVEGWSDRLDALEGAGDAEAGERIFHHASMALCANCHRHGGRGKVVGPDLSALGERATRRWLLESILMPGKEIAPEFLPRTMHLKNGDSVTGIRLRSSTREFVRDANGHTVGFPRDEIERIEELSVSLMPPGLVYTMTDRELRDLLVFLEGESLE
ncbi:MAG: c-type cytochrome [Verrucomicrobiales bacterium]|nr:c-type cytochrome [Verrucomicrobiales bacterium]